MRAIFHLQGGLGDYYYLLGMAPAILAERKPDEVIVYMDSVYWSVPGYALMRDAATRMVQQNLTHDIRPIPPEACSYQLWYDDPEDNFTGPLQEKIERDFLFCRKQATKDYMRAQIQDGDLFFTTIIGLSHEWRDGRNVPLEYPVRQLSFAVPEKEIGELTGLLRTAGYDTAERKLLWHVRANKDAASTPDKLLRILIWCAKNDIFLVLIGLRSNIQLSSMRIVDLREGISFEANMWLVNYAAYYLGSSSMFTYHRLFSGKPTLSLTAESLGTHKRIYHRDCLANANNVFLDADTDQCENVFAVLRGWYGF